MNRSRLPRVFRPTISWACGLFALVMIGTLPGCLLMDWSAAWFSWKTPAPDSDSSANPLKKIPKPKTAVTLEIVFVERPVNDPLLGEQLWDEVDQIGSLPPADRETLAEMGIRVGRVGANPPRALQTLMGMSTEIGNEKDKRLVGRRVVLPSGAETEVNMGLPHPQISVQIPTSDGMEIQSFENVRGVFRMKAKELQEGWARLEFLPEIHHGRRVNRPVAVRGGWQLNTAQAIERLYGQEFSLDLNLGEMVLITGQAKPADSVGNQFFYSPEYSDKLANSQVERPDPQGEERSSAAGPGIQRLLIIRLADLSKAKSIYSEQSSQE